MKTSLGTLSRLAPASLLILVACAGAQAPPTPSASPPAGPEATAALWRQVQKANADTACDGDSQCHSLGVGAKACGGPERYLAWSSKQSDGAALKALAEQHSAARRADDARAAMMSTCSLVSDPGAVCRAGRCVLNAASPGSPGGPANQK
ncbi:hypothetical protein [Duganella aceris]|uniref:DUF4189 domain-containing protein n=1 Tax=Duganella aceris TaxID=2703883 RepID=A0ABX0FD45_9BURK|nr:hypothetical protein [Duganella aceris]NGZ82777.1 hypothetical protein [Duganella aceris]